MVALLHTFSISKERSKDYRFIRLRNTNEKPNFYALRRTLIILNQIDRNTLNFDKKKKKYLIDNSVSKIMKFFSLAGCYIPYPYRFLEIKR